MTKVVAVLGENRPRPKQRTLHRVVLGSFTYMDKMALLTSPWLCRGFVKPLGRSLFREDSTCVEISVACQPCITPSIRIPGLETQAPLTGGLCLELW